MDSKQVYEIGFHILPTVAEENLGDEVSLIRGAIEKNGSVISEEFPKMRDLTYEMEKNLDAKNLKFDRAYFGWIKFEMDSDQVAEVDSVAKSHKNVLRYLIIKTVRENTLLTKPKEEAEKSEEETDSKKKPEKKEEMSEKEVDESIEELVIE